MVTPAARRESVTHLRTSLGMNERLACGIIGANRTSIRYRSKRGDDTALLLRLRELAQQRRRNRKRTQQLYTEEGLPVRNANRADV